MPEKQLNLFNEPVEMPTGHPPIGSHWEDILNWVLKIDLQMDRRTYPSKYSLVDIVFDRLELSNEISLNFICHMLWCIKVFDIKQNNYGPKNIAMLGEKGIISRVKNDKFSRLETLSAHPESALQGEPALDAWHDTCVYGGIGAMVHVGDWPTVEELNLAPEETLEGFCRSLINATCEVDFPMSAEDAMRSLEEFMRK